MVTNVIMEASLVLICPYVAHLICTWSNYINFWVASIRFISNPNLKDKNHVGIRLDRDMAAMDIYIYINGYIDLSLSLSIYIYIYGYWSTSFVDLVTFH